MDNNLSSSQELDNHRDDWLELTLFTCPRTIEQVPERQALPDQGPPRHSLPKRRPYKAGRRPRTSRTKDEKKSMTPPYPWAMDHAARVHSLKYLQENGIFKISGQVHCKKCHREFDIEYDLINKFAELSDFIFKKKEEMRDRAPSIWSNPKLPTCIHCNEENSVKPVISKRNKINWLFLLLGNLLGCCNLSELKYYCKNTSQHRTGAKDRLLYLTYLNLCYQLQPDRVFLP